MSSLEAHIAKLKEDPVLSELLSPLLEFIDLQFEQLKVQVEQLKAQSDEIASLRSEVAVLKEQLNQNSNNSNKPPSSDGYRKKSVALNPRSGKQGGQAGHKGNTLKMVAEPDIIDQQFICSHCDEPASDVVQMERRQVFDLPDPRLIVTEYQRGMCYCSACDRYTQTSFPDGVGAPVQYGSGVKAMCALLHNDYHVPLKRVGRLFKDLFGHEINDGTILQSQHHLYNHLQASEEVILASLLQSKCLHVDETGIRVEGKLHWFHAATTGSLSHFYVHQKRGSAAHAESILPAYRGRMIHDCFKPYFKYTAADHGLCNSHLLRELAAFDHRKWARSVQDLLLAAYRSTEQVNYDLYKTCYFKLLKEGLSKHPRPPGRWMQTGKVTRGKARNLIRRLYQYHNEVWAFARDPDVPFTNNQVERDIRMVKLKVKVNGGFRTQQGAEIFARIAGFCSTVRKQGLHTFAELKLAFSIPHYVIALKPLQAHEVPK